MASGSGRSQGPTQRPSKYPGERLGRPQYGPGSVARVVRRAIALCLDWLIASILANFVTGSWYPADNAKPLHQLVVYIIWVLLMIVTVPLLGGTIGHRCCGLAVTPLSGGWPGVWRPFVRALMLALVIPALVWDSDQRGFHDRIAKTVLVRS